jgi:hypothetical protein
LGIGKAEMEGYFDNKDRLSYEEFLHIIDRRSAGVARVSMGIASTFGDVYRFYEFTKTFRDRLLRDLTTPKVAASPLISFTPSQAVRGMP